jgi:predicted metal-dependent enzyme (double-stranded beta helix superfamily)
MLPNRGDEQVMPHVDLLAPAIQCEETRRSITPGVAKLLAEVDAACDRSTEAMRHRIIAALARAVVQPDLLSMDQRALQTGSYARHLMYDDPAGRFTIVSIVWGPDQFSPPHAHHTWCAYAVHENELQETLYAWDDEMRSARPVLARTRAPGYISFADAGLDQIHRLGNSGSEPAISLHVYGIDGARVGTHLNKLIDVAV